MGFVKHDPSLDGAQPGPALSAIPAAAEPEDGSKVSSSTTLDAQHRCLRWKNTVASVCSLVGKFVFDAVCLMAPVQFRVHKLRHVRGAQRNIWNVPTDRFDEQAGPRKAAMASARWLGRKCGASFRLYGCPACWRDCCHQHGCLSV